MATGLRLKPRRRLHVSLLHPDDLEPALHAVQAALSGETKGFEAEFRVRHKDGTYRWMLSRGAVVRNAAGLPVRFIGSDVDTTDLKRAEAALRESEQRFRTFVDHASDAFFLLDERMVVLDVNRRACQSLGYTRDELVGMTPTDLDADVTPADLEDIERRLNAGESVAFESRHRRKDGTIFPVEIRAQAFWEGGRHFTVALARDITERKRAEEALRLSEQRYRSLVEATAAIVWTMAASGLAECGTTELECVHGPKPRTSSQAGAGLTPSTRTIGLTPSRTGPRPSPPVPCTRSSTESVATTANTGTC